MSDGAVLAKNSHRGLTGDQFVERRQGCGAVVIVSTVRSGQDVEADGHWDSDIPEWLACAGDYNKALEELEKLVHARKPNALQIAFDPAYTPLHGDARYQALMHEIYNRVTEKTTSR